MLALRSVLAFLSLAALLAGAPSCAAPIQNGGVVMSPHAEERLDIMCRYRANDAQHVCADPPEE